MTWRSAYYKKLGIERRRASVQFSKLTSRAAVSEISPRCNFAKTPRNNEEKSVDFLKYPKFNSKSELKDCPFLYKSKSTKNIDFNFSSNLKNYEEKKVPKWGDVSTSDSTPEKSSFGEDNVFESYIIPDIDDFRLDFRNKIMDNVDKSHKAHRQRYLHKLTMKKVWLLPDQKPKTHQTCIIFDWDDTILWTTFLNPNGYCGNEPISESQVEILAKLDEAGKTILQTAIKNGKVFIITNAAEGWVEFSAQKYLPNVFKILDKVTVISARTQYECQFPGDAYQWKNKAFQHTLKDLELGAVTNLIAIGDSNIEMEASKHLALKFPRALLKTVKFRELPSPDELIKQLTLVHLKLPEIFSNVKNLTIRLERREKEDISKLADTPSCKN